MMIPDSQDGYLLPNPADDVEAFFNRAFKRLLDDAPWHAPVRIVDELPNAPSNLTTCHPDRPDKAVAVSVGDCYSKDCPVLMVSREYVKECHRNKSKGSDMLRYVLGDVHIRMCGSVIEL
jgi:hypothetical protein